MGKTLTPKTRKVTKPKFTSGQSAIVKFTAGQLPVTIIEDRGYIGKDHFVFVRSASPDEDPPITFEVYAENLILTKPSK